MPDTGRHVIDRLTTKAEARWEPMARALGLASGDDLTFILLVPLVGLLTGLVAVAIYKTLDLVQNLAWWYWSNKPLLEAIKEAPPWQRIAAPTLGGVIVTLIVLITRMEVRGHGMSGIIEAVALRGGRVPALPAIVRELAGIATVGTGGALGREGPMIRTGAMLGSVMGRTWLSGRQLKILVGCGAAAGMAAAYNSPIGAAIFAMEVILGNFALELFGPIVVASVCSTAVARALRGSHPVYDIPHYTIVSGWELPLFLLLGCAAGIASVGITRGVRGGETLFDRLVWFAPKPVRPILGMALVGVIGIKFPEVYGNGFDVVNDALHEQISPAWLLVIPAVKMIATAITLGSGCSGGLFTPTLLVGALLGGAFGCAAHAIAPGAVSSPGAYALVGMAAITAGTSHAPVSSILIVFEMTGDYDVILPLMLASIASAIVAKRIYPQSIYTESLARRGVKISSRLEEIVLEARTVDELTRQDVVTVAPDAPLSIVLTRLAEARRVHAFVVDQEKRYLGAVSLHDLVHAARTPAEAPEPAVALDAIDPRFPTLKTGERLTAALKTLARVDAERLPVVDAQGMLRGSLAKRDVLAVYEQEVLGTQTLLARIGATTEQARYIQLPPGLSVREVIVPEEFLGRTLGDLALPRRFGLWAIAIERLIDGGLVRSSASASTILERGDRLVLLGTDAGYSTLATEVERASAMKSGTITP